MRLRTVLFLCLIAAAVVDASQVVPPFLRRPSPVGFTCDITAASAGLTDVQNAVNDAGIGNGNTVCIPAGTATWTGTLSVTEGITVRGATNCTLGTVNGKTNIPTACSTVIRDGRTTGDSIVSFDLVAGQTSRLAHLEFNDNGGGTSFNGILNCNNTSGNSGQVRFDHMMWTNMDGLVSSWRGCYGVADHINGVNTGSNFFYLYQGTENFVNLALTDQSWADAPRFGTEFFMFIEDSVFSHAGHAIEECYDSHTGGRFVVRYSYHINCWVELHGTDSASRGRGTRAVEVYENTFVCDASCGSDPTFVNFRSATGRVYNNSLSGSYGSTPFINLTCQRCASLQCGVWLCATGSNSWDVNSGGSLVEALDQPGRGQGDDFNGDTSGGSPGTGPPSGWPSGKGNNQVDEPIYEWNNVFGASTNVGYNLGTGGTTIRSGEHYVVDTEAPGYTAYTYPHPLAATP